MHEARRRAALRRVRRGHHARAPRATDDARAMAGRRRGGCPHLHPRGLQGRGVLPEARAPGRPSLRRDRAHHVPLRAHRRRDRCPTELAVVAWAAQLGTLTFHPWPVRRDDVDPPDQLRHRPRSPSRHRLPRRGPVAHVLRALLDEHGIWAGPRRRAARAPHLRAHRAALGFIDVRRATIAFGRELERRMPGRVTMKWWKEERGAKIFVDYNQIARDRTIASAYSIRPNPRATVSRRCAGRSSTTSPVRLRRAHDAGPRSPRSATGVRHRRHGATPSRRSCSGTSATSKDLGDLPYPPDYPKMPGEPKRVQPSRKKA